MAVSAMFNFIAKNPPMALICGGVLLLVVSPATKTMSASADYSLLGVVLIGFGIVLNLLWIFKDRL